VFSYPERHETLEWLCPVVASAGGECRHVSGSLSLAVIITIHYDLSWQYLGILSFVIVVFVVLLLLS
jgi:hypothetical protein